MTPLRKKLGLKPGLRACILNAPPHYADLLGSLPDGLVQVETLEPDLDFIQAFALDRAALDGHFAAAVPHLTPTGMLWLCWPKKASSITSDLSSDVVREAGLAAGLVDVKVCAVDADWSALKFVYRLRDR